MDTEKSVKIDTVPDEAVRAATEAYIAVMYPGQMYGETALDLRESAIEAAISAYRTHTLAVAGGVERALRDLSVSCGWIGEDEGDVVIRAADLIAAQREEINAWAKRWSDKRDEADNNLQDLESARERIAELEEACGRFASAAANWPNFADMDELLIVNIRNSEVDRAATIRVGDLRRARAALGGEL